VVTLAAEFPNDNPDLHAGVIWVCRDVTGPALPERISHEPPVIEVIAETMEEAISPRESGIFVAALAEGTFEFEEEPILVEELTPFEAIAVEMVAPPNEPVAETILIGDEILAEIEELAAEDEPPPSTTILPPVEAPPPAATVTTDPWTAFVTVLVDIANGQGAPQIASTLPAMLETDATAKAWAGILRGTSEDWDAIGGTMLDEWAADLLARQLGAPDTSSMLKRELRDRGVAAFGMIEAVAA